MNRRLLIAISSLVAVAAAALLWVGSWSGGDPMMRARTNLPNSSATSDAASPVVLNQASEAFGRAQVPSQVPNQWDVEISVGTDVKRLLADGSTASLVSAVAMISECANIEDSKKLVLSLPSGVLSKEELAYKLRHIQKMKSRCSDVDHQLATKRASLLEGGMYSNGKINPNVALAFFALGPNGRNEEFEVRPDDLNVKTWVAKAVGYVEESAASGDLKALVTAASIYGEGGFVAADYGKSLAYELVVEKIQDLSGGARAFQRKYAIDRTTSRLSDAEISESRLRSELLFKSCCLALKKN
jgi:hypothetical protein